MAMSVQYEITPHKHKITVHYDKFYVRRQLKAKALLAGKDDTFIYEDERVVAAVRGALRRKFPTIKFNVWRYDNITLNYVQVRWQAGPDPSNVEAVVARAITKLATVYKGANK
jgi:hypothetical protein